MGQEGKDEPSLKNACAGQGPELTEETGHKQYDAPLSNATTAETTQHCSSSLPTPPNQPDRWFNDAYGTSSRTFFENNSDHDVTKRQQGAGQQGAAQQGATDSEDMPEDQGGGRISDPGDTPDLVEPPETASEKALRPIGDVGQNFTVCRYPEEIESSNPFIRIQREVQQSSFSLDDASDPHQSYSSSRWQATRIRSAGGVSTTHEEDTCTTSGFDSVQQNSWMRGRRSKRKPVICQACQAEFLSKKHRHSSRYDANRSAVTRSKSLSSSNNNNNNNVNSEILTAKNLNVAAAEVKTRSKRTTSGTEPGICPQFESQPSILMPSDPAKCDTLVRSAKQSCQGQRRVSHAGRLAQRLSGTRILRYTGRRRTEPEGRRLIPFESLPHNDSSQSGHSRQQEYFAGPETRLSDRHLVRMKDQRSSSLESMRRMPDAVLAQSRPQKAKRKEKHNNENMTKHRGMWSEDCTVQSPGHAQSLQKEFFQSNVSSTSVSPRSSDLLISGTIDEDDVSDSPVNIVIANSSEGDDSTAAESDGTSTAPSLWGSTTGGRNFVCPLCGGPVIEPSVVSDQVLPAEPLMDLRSRWYDRDGIGVELISEINGIPSAMTTYPTTHAILMPSTPVTHYSDEPVDDDEDTSSSSAI